MDVVEKSSKYFKISPMWTFNNNRNKIVNTKPPGRRKSITFVALDAIWTPSTVSRDMVYICPPLLFCYTCFITFRYSKNILVTISISIMFIFLKFSKYRVCKWNTSPDGFLFWSLMSPPFFRMHGTHWQVETS